MVAGTPSNAIFAALKSACMQFYNLLIRYRFWIGCVVLIGAVVLNLTGTGFWPSFPLYFIAVIAIFTHFFIGPLRLIQEPMEKGEVDKVEKILNSVWFPNLLYTPIRSTFYTIKGNLAMMQQDFDAAEKHLKKSSSLGAPMPEAEGANKLQLGMMAMQKGDIKQAEGYIRAAIRAGIPDKESEAVAYLSMCQIFMNKADRNSLRAAKDFFRKAKACKPTTKQVVDQIKEIEKYISRIPG